VSSGPITGTNSVVAIDAHPRPVDSLRIDVPACADRLADIRHRLIDWLTPIGLSAEDIADIVLVVNEAATNCIEHAYRDVDDGVIRLSAEDDGRRIFVDITDFGVWRPPAAAPDSTRGRGLPLIRAISAEVDIDASAGGTTVRMTFSPSRQVCGNRTT